MLIALSWTALAGAQTAEQYIATGRNDLVLDNLWGADTNFTAALAVSPTNQTANLLKAATRLLVLPQTPAGSNFLVKLGFPATNRYLPHVPEASLPKDTNNYPIFPANYNATNFVWFFRTNVMAAIGASLSNLANITDTSYTLSLSSNETSFTLSSNNVFTEDVTLDYGDIQMLRALLSAVQFGGYTLNAENCSAIIPQVVRWMETNGFTLQLALATYPKLLTMQNTTDLALSKSTLTNAIGLYFTASDFIRNQRPAGVQRLFNLDTNDVAAEAEFRTDLTNALLSLNTPTEFNTTNIATTINAGAWFSGTNSLRKFVPQFNGDIYVDNTLPDYTFGGILPYLPAYQTEKLLRKEFHNYEGIYIGDGGLSDSNWQINNGFGGYGSFAVFVGTNQQATLVGTDNGDGSDDGNAFGVILQFSVDRHGNWQWSNNNIDAYGGIGRDGSFWGEMDVFTNNSTFSVWFNANEQSPLGPFEKSAGYYIGTTSPKPYSILAADGEIFSCVFHSLGIEPATGGQAQVDSSNYYITTNIGGTVVSGTFNSSTLQITGTSRNPSGSVTSWTMNRSANVPFDVPPAITVPPANEIATAGSNATFSVTATGSPPLCYQWYCNSLLLPGATAANLEVTNASVAVNGNNYSVSVQNVVGETNATASLTVQFVLTNQLGVRAVGLGTINPNYSNAWLEIGRSYSMTATAASGFSFTNWTISTNWLGNAKTNNVTVQFVMESNLTLQVSFVDVKVPTLSITAPTSGQKMTNALANVRGTASDNWRVTDVWYQLNTNAWSLATTTNGWTNWSVTLALVKGTNTVSAYATDPGGNISPTQSVSFFSSNTFKLQLSFQGGGPHMTGNGLSFDLQISPGLSGHVEASTNLVSWVTLTNFVGTNATLDFRDAAATNYDQRFYRAVVP
jgi:hypothetical protein